MKKFISGLMVLSLLLVFGMVVYLEAMPQWCSTDWVFECEYDFEGTYSYYYLWTVMYNGSWTDVYDTYCDYGGGPQWWGACYDIDDIW
jgi:hypothetical protein